VDDEDDKIVDERVDDEEETEDEEETKEMNTFNGNDGGGDIILQDMEPQVEEELPQCDPEENVTHQHKYDLRPNRTLSYMHKFAFLSVWVGVKKMGREGERSD
jgi:hypothetical protein